MLFINKTSALMLSIVFFVFLFWSVGSVLLPFYFNYEVNNSFITQPWQMYIALWQQGFYALLGLVALLVLFFPLIAYFSLIAFSRRVNLYGRSHFMSLSEINQAGLLQEKGVLLGKQRGTYICAGGQVGVTVVAPPRSGKGVGPIICNILNFDGSVLVVDIRGETYQATSGFRQKHGAVYRISPLDPEGRSHSFNPLDFLSKNRSQRISQVQIIANILLPTPERVDPIWSTEGRDILEGVILFLYDLQDGKVTLSQAARMFKTADFPALLEKLIETYSDTMDPYVRETFSSFSEKPDREQSGVASNVKSAIKLFLAPQIEACTSYSDFSPYDFRKKRIAVYLNITPDQIELLSKRSF